MKFEDVRQLALAWPDVEEGTSYGTPALKAGGRLMARLSEDADTLVVSGVDADEREMLMQAAPEVFFVTDHYRPWPVVLICLSLAAPEQVEPLLWRRWSALASRRMVRQLAVQMVGAAGARA